MMYMVMYLLSFMFVVSSDDWFLIWLGMEMNMLSFVFLIYNRKNILNIESCLKYFFIQSIGSAMFLSLFYLYNSEFFYLSILILSYKVGAGPFFFWFPSVCSGLSWMSCFFIMTFQKLIPLILMLSFVSWMLWMMSFMSLLMGVLGSLNQIDLKRLMAYSSIHHLGWIMMCIMMEENLWLMYMIMYMIMMIPLLVLMSNRMMNKISSVSLMNSKWSFTLLLLSIGGMPPMLGFFLKWMTFLYIMNMGIVMLLFMIIISVIMLYIYIRLIFDFIMEYYYLSSWMTYSYNKIKNLSSDNLSIIGSLIGSLIGLVLLM